MNSARYNRVMEVFMAAVSLEGDRRAAYLTRVCGADDTLRAEVQSLLNYHTQHTLLNEAAPPMHSDDPTAQSRKVTSSWSPWGRQRRFRPPLAMAAGATLLILLMTAAWVHYHVRASLRSSLATQLDTVLRADVAALENWIAGELAAVSTWADNERLKHIVGELVATKRATRALDEAEIPADESNHLSQDVASLLAPATKKRGFHSWGIVTRDGTIVAGSRPMWIGAPISPAGAPYLSRLNLGQAVFVIPSLERRFVFAIESLPGDPAVAVAAPIRNSDGSIVAALAFGYDIDDEFTRILSIAQLGETGETYAFDKDAVLLSNLRDRQTALDVGLITRAEPCALHVELRDPGGDLTSGYRTDEPLRSRPMTLLAARATAGIDGLELNGYRNYRGTQVVGAWRWLPAYGFGVGTEMAFDEAYRPLREVNRAFGFLIGAVVLTSLVAGFASTLVTRLRRQIGRAELLGAYVLGDLIGEGGMGKVYRAWHRALKRTAAVKLLDDRIADAEMTERFKREAHLTCQLTHPSTIQVFDFGVTPSGSFYYVMEYLPGYTLQQILAAESFLGVARSLHLLLQVCGSLQEAHDLGMIHRDIKPGNLMITHRGGIADYVKVLDFGLARLTATTMDPELTRSRTIVGTPHFMAPESILSPRDIDARADIYSLGAVAFVMLTGRNVFPETQPTELFRRVVSDNGPPPSSCSSQSIPVEFDELVASCLSVEPTERPASIAEVAAVMERLSKQFPWTQQEAREWWTSFKSEAHENPEMSRAPTSL